MRFLLPVRAMTWKPARKDSVVAFPLLSSVLFTLARGDRGCGFPVRKRPMPCVGVRS